MKVRLKPDPTYDDLRLSELSIEMESALRQKLDRLNLVWLQVDADAS